MTVVGMQVGHHGEVHRCQAVAAVRGGTTVQIVARRGQHGVEEWQCREVADGVVLVRIIVGPQVQGHGHQAVAAMNAVPRERGGNGIVGCGECQHGVAPII